MVSPVETFRRSAVTLLTVANLVATGVSAPPAAALSTLERQLVELVNAARDRQDFRPLAVRDDLSRYAGRHSQVMAEEGRLYHSTGLRSICCWSAVAENVGYGPDVATVHRALMRSQPHRENLLSRRMRGSAWESRPTRTTASGSRRSSGVRADLGSGQPESVPFVDGTPDTRGSSATASRSARATALN